MSGAAEWAADEGAAGLPAPHSSMTETEFSVFYEATSRGLLCYLRRLTGEGAEDLLQESYCRMLRHPVAGLDGAQRKSYLYRVATNLARDQFRRGKFQPVSLEGRGHPLAKVADSAAQSDVERALASAPPRDRELVWLAYVEGASHREIAAMTGLKEASVRPMLYRARQRLAAALRACGWGTEQARSEP
jgi:RNA polymerase sigma-70 factor (ECF subfamily)